MTSPAGFPPTQWSVMLHNLPLESPQNVIDAWELVHHPRTVLSVLPAELEAARDRIMLAAAGHGLTLAR